MIRNAFTRFPEWVLNHRKIVILIIVLLFSSVILVIGFGMTMISTINDMFYFGLLTCVCIFVVLLADLFFTPSRSLLIKPFGKETA